MKDTRTNAEKLAANNAKSDLLESLGFEIISGDYQSVVAGIGGIDFDFSATANDTESIIRSAIQQAHNIGFVVGEDNIQCQIKAALGID